MHIAKFETTSLAVTNLRNSHNAHYFRFRSHWYISGSGQISAHHTNEQCWLFPGLGYYVITLCGPSEFAALSETLCL